MHTIHFKDEFLLTDAHLVNDSLSLLKFALGGCLRGPFVLYLMVQLLDGITAAEKKQIALLLLPTALVRLLAPVGEGRARLVH